MHIIHIAPVLTRRTVRSVAAIAIAFVTFTAGGCHRGPSGPGSMQLQRPVAVEQYISASEAYHQGDLDKASTQLLSAVRANPNLVMARIMLADIYVTHSDYRNAKAQYQKLTELDPYTGSNFYGLGLSQEF